jgi:hypothetical protein
MTDALCPEHLRGTYLAFSPEATGQLTAGQSHLQALRCAGKDCSYGWQGSGGHGAT